MSKFEILCTTMHQTDFSKLNEMNVHTDIVYANQCNRTAYEELEFDGHTAKMISTETRGVGKNRNLALIYASADICLMADDDVRYADDMEEKVLGEFARHPDADVIVFHFASNDPHRKPPQYLKTKKWPKLARTPWGSIRIAFRLNSVRRANAWFTALFGGGCLFPSGEDSMWIKALRRAGLTFYVSQETIGEVSYATSTWFTGYDEKYFYGVGACYAAINLKTSFVKYLYMALRTRGKSDLSLSQKLKMMNYGRDGYKKMLSFDDYMKEKGSRK